MAASEFRTRQLTWPELDFTSTPPSHHRNLAVTSQCFDPRTAMDMRDPLAWMGADDGQSDRACGNMSPIYQTGPFTLSDLQDMEPDTTPSGQSSQSTSRSNSHSMPTEGQTDQSGLSPQLGRVCPLLAGQTFECSPQLCGPNAACLDFPAIPEIEDCASMPFIAQNSSNGPEVTQNFQAAPVSMSDKTSSRASTSQFKEPTRSSQHRLNRTNVDDPDSKSHSKKAHSLVERRYRENLNGNIAQLHLALLKTKRVGDSTPKDKDDDWEEPRQALSKVRKSDVMLEAVDYVHQTEVELRHMANEIELLTTRVRQLEKLVKCEECPLVKQLVNIRLGS
jgi:hypothetical protein